MQRSEYEESTKRISFAMPKTLYRKMLVKMQFSTYGTVSELCRSLLREWIDKEIIEVKTIGKIERES